MLNAMLWLHLQPQLVWVVPTYIKGALLMTMVMDIIRDNVDDHAPAVVEYNHLKLCEAARLKQAVFQLPVLKVVSVEVIILWY